MVGSRQIKAVHDGFFANTASGSRSTFIWTEWFYGQHVAIFCFLFSREEYSQRKKVSNRVSDSGGRPVIFLLLGYNKANRNAKEELASAVARRLDGARALFQGIFGKKTCMNE